MDIEMAARSAAQKECNWAVCLAVQMAQWSAARLVGEKGYQLAAARVSWWAV